MRVGNKHDLYTKLCNHLDNCLYSNHTITLTSTTTQLYMHSPYAWSKRHDIYFPEYNVSYTVGIDSICGIA